MMNETGALQVNINPAEGGVLTVHFTGISGMSDIDLFKNAIDGQIKSDPTIHKAVFDVTGVDPVMNAAGRIYDLACYYAKKTKMDIKVRLPSEIYATLQEITPAELPKPPVKETRARGVTIVVVPEPVKTAPQEARPAKPARRYDLSVRPKIVMSCRGKIRSVRENTVTVSLFIAGEEVIGELDRDQFPRGPVQANRIFKYRALVTAPGKTEVIIDFALEQRPVDDEDEHLLDLAAKIAREKIDFGKL